MEALMPVQFNAMIASFMRQGLRKSLPMLIRRMDAVADGRTTPSLETMSIGSGRRVTAAVIFFDIRGFTRRTGSEDPQMLKRTLLLLNCVIPSMMRVLYRYGAYVEKNTGDGLMAILGVETQDNVTAGNALDAAEEMLRVLHFIVNPELLRLGIDPVDARIGVDMGQILISRIGLANGSAEHPRNALTAVGPAANRASKLQALAGTNEIWCGDSIRNSAGRERLSRFDCVTPADWPWAYGGNPHARYDCWRYDADATDPFGTLLGGTSRIVRG
jgi:adenylate cyclase